MEYLVVDTLNWSAYILSNCPAFDIYRSSLVFAQMFLNRFRFSWIVRTSDWLFEREPLQESLVQFGVTSKSDVSTSAEKTCQGFSGWDCDLGTRVGQLLGVWPRVGGDAMLSVFVVDCCVRLWRMNLSSQSLCVLDLTEGYWRCI